MIAFAAGFLACYLIPTSIVGVQTWRERCVDPYARFDRLMTKVLVACVFGFLWPAVLLIKS
jgi:hypothetical protein